MAQVKKLQGGGTPTDPIDLFEWEGVGSYERKPMVQTLTKNLTGYADHLGLKGERRTRFLDNGAAAIKALESGLLRRLANGAYEDRSGVMSSTGKYDKNWLGKLKDTDNNAYNDLAGYFDAYINKASVYDPEKAKKEAEEKAKKDKTKFVGDAYLKDRLAQKYFAGTFNTSAWFDHRDENGRLTSIADELDSADYNTIYGKYLWDNTGIDSADILRSKAKALSDNLRNGKLDDADYNTAAALGINLDLFLKKPEEAPKEPTREEQLASTKQAFIKEKLDAGMTQALAEQLWNNLQTLIGYQNQAAVDASNQQVAALDNNRDFEAWYTAHSNPTGTPWRATLKGSANYDEGRMKSVMNGRSAKDFFSQDLSEDILRLKRQFYSNDKARSAQHLINNLDYGVKSGYFADLGDGNYLIPHTLNSNYVGYVYNPSSRSYLQISLLANKNWKDFVRRYYYNQKGWTLPESNKLGGVLKYLSGGDFFQSNYDAANLYTNDVASQYQAVQTQKKAETKKKALATNRTPELYTAGQKQIGTEFTTLEKVRLGTAAADVLSAISAFVPGYGTAVSAVTGVGSTLTNLGADIADDSVSGWQAAGNAALGLGLDVVGLIPGLGAGAKAGKIAKVFAKIAPKAMLAWGAYLGGGPAIAAAQKLMKDSNSMTVDDWKALAGGLQLLAGGARYAGGKKQLGNISTKNKYVLVRAKDGSMVKMSAGQFDLLKNASGLTEQNKVFARIAPGKELSKEFKGRSLTHPFKTGPQTSKGTERVFLENNNPTMGHDELLFRRIAGVDTRIPTPKWLQGFGQVKNPNYKGPARTAGQSAPRRIQAKPLAEGDTRVRQGSNVVRTKALTPQEIKQINRNRKAAGQPALTLKEIDAINSRVANNTVTSLPTLQERAAQRRYDREHSVESDLARAREEIEAANRLANRPVIAALAPSMVASLTIQPRMPLQQFIDLSIPKRASTGAARANRQKMYEGLFPSSTAQVASLTVRPRLSTKLVIESRVPKRTTAKGRALRLKDLETAFRDPANFRPSDRARFIVADQTKSASTPILLLIDSRLPKRPATGAARKNKLKMLEELLGPLQKADNRKVAAKKAAKTKAAKKKDKERDGKLSSLGGRYRQGGTLIPRFKNPSGPISNTRSTANWLTDIYATEAMPAWLSTYNTSNYEDFNQLQKDYYANLNATGFDPSKTTKVSYNQGVYDRQGRFDRAASGINGVIEKLAGPNGKILRAGMTGDNAKGHYLDGYFGFLEYLRHGGMQSSGLSDAQLADILKVVGANDLEYYFDPTTGMGLLKPKKATASPVVSSTEVPQTVAKAPAKSTTARAGANSKKKEGPLTSTSLRPEDVLATTRMLMGLGTNARAAAQYKAGLKPVITDSPWRQHRVEYDYFALRAADNEADRLAAFAAKSRTANAQDQFAGELEANTRGAQLRMQGNLQAAARFYLTDAQDQEDKNWNRAAAIENANANTGRFRAIEASKAQIDSALTTAQYAQILAPWMAGIENEYRQNRAIQRQADASAYQRALLAQMQSEYDAAVEAGDLKKAKEVTDKYYTDLAAYNKRAYSSPWLVLRTTTLPALSGYSWIDYAKAGGKLTAREREVILRAADFNKRLLADNRQFHKDIMESKREHSKLIAGMSNLTAELIKKWNEMEIIDKTLKLQGGGGIPAFVSFTNVPQSQPTAPYMPAEESKKAEDSNGTGIIDKNMMKALYETGLVSDTVALAEKFDMFFLNLDNPFNKNSAVAKYKLLIPSLAALREGKRQLLDAVEVCKKNEALGELAITTDGRYYVRDENGNPKIVSQLSLGDDVLTNADLADLRANKYAGANNISVTIANGVSSGLVNKMIWDLISKIGSDSESLEFLRTKRGQDIKDGIDLLIAEGEDGVYKIGQSQKGLSAKAQLALQYLLVNMPANYKAYVRGKAALAGLDPGEGSLKIILGMVSAGLDLSASTTISYDAAATKGTKGDKGSQKEMEITPLIAYQTGKLGSPFQMQINPGNSYSMVVDALQYGQPLDQNGKPIENGSLELVLKTTGFGTIANIGNGVYIGNLKIDPLNYSQVYVDTGQMSRAWLPSVLEADGTVHPDYDLLDEYSELLKDIKALGNRATKAQIESLVRNSPLSEYLVEVKDGIPIWDLSKFKPYLMLNAMASGDSHWYNDKFDGVINPDTIGNWGTRLRSIAGIDPDMQKTKMQNALGLEMKGDIYSTIAYIPISDSTTRAMIASGEYPIMTRENPVAINDYRLIEAQQRRLNTNAQFAGASANKL